MREEKLLKLKESLIERGSITVGAAGDPDSIFLLIFAKEVLGDKVRAITAVAPNIAGSMVEAMKEFCDEYSVPHDIVIVDLLDVIRYNGKERCYACKRKMFTTLTSYSDDIADASVASEKNESKPGNRAVSQLNIWRPLKEAGITKEDVRAELLARGLSKYDKPTYACLASRIPFGKEITVEKLEAVNKVEVELRELGFTQFRARHHGEVVRIELLSEEWDMNKFKHIDAIGKDAGFKFVALDLEGYRRGRMNR